MLQLRVAFRVDASIDIGTGHVMRCLTLADALKKQGAQSTFICRLHDGHLLSLIAQRGHSVRALPGLEQHEQGCADDDLSHAAWLGTHWKIDAQDTLQALSDQHVDWLIVDHYALDQKWQRMVRGVCQRIMVIDDLADRSHDCDVLLDQNLGRVASDYSGLLPPASTALIGPTYALLRAEFSERRSESLARREPPQLQHLLITLGGVDKYNATGQILNALATCPLPESFRISVVLGASSPWVKEIQAQAQQMPCATQVHIGVSHMAQLMADCDLAISAAGGTVWELCCLGLPSLIWVIAENQKSGAAALQAKGAVMVVGCASEVQIAMQRLIQPKGNVLLRKMSEQAAAVTDGTGAQQIIEWLQHIHV